MTTPSDPAPHNNHQAYAAWDAAYVLGALSVPDRLEYEAHLATCERCRSAVGELAGIPGLLAKVPPAELLAEVDELPLPPTLVPRIPTRRRRRWVPLVGAAAAALVAGVVVGYAVRPAPDEGPATGVVAASGTTRVAFASVRDVPITAVVDVTPTAGGTRLKVECQYGYRDSDPLPPATTGPSGTATPQARQYRLYVIDREGNEVDAASWTAVPGRVSDPETVSPLPFARIAAVEIRGESGETALLRADL